MQENIEIWKDVVGYEGYYQVSNLGRVKSLDRKINKNGLIYEINGKILSPRKVGKGYLSVALQINKNRKNFMVHRLVAECFIKNSFNLKEVNHKDENKENNNLSNLEWCDHKYNSNYGNRGKKISEKLLLNHVRRKRIAMMKNGVHLETFNSIVEANNKFVKNGKSVNACLIGKTKNCIRI